MQSGWVILTGETDTLVQTYQMQFLYNKKNHLKWSLCQILVVGFDYS